MDFPAYVPAAVREHITSLIEGDQWEPQGWAASLANADEDLARIDRTIETYLRRGEDDYLPSLRDQRVKALAHRNGLAGNVECLQRLAHDARMRDAFVFLTHEFTEDQHWRSFIYAAWAARGDYSKCRDRLKRATELTGEIAKAANELARLISQLAETGITGPDEFYSIPELLRQTDNHEMQGHNLCMWRSMRRHVLGDNPRGNVSETEPAAEVRNVLRYAWGTAPDFPALLATVANAAKAFEPAESGMVAAAIKSRQRSPKAEYLRAFWSLLQNIHGFTLTTPVMQAMAVTANVVINQPDVDVTYDDVRKSLAKLGGGRLENSGKK